jgi:hypothetical protein
MVVGYIVPAVGQFQQLCEAVGEGGAGWAGSWEMNCEATRFGQDRWPVCQLESEAKAPCRIPSGRSRLRLDMLHKLAVAVAVEG